MYPRGTPKTFEATPTCGGLQNQNPYMWWLNDKGVGGVGLYHYILLLLLLLLLLYSLYETKGLHPIHLLEKPLYMGVSKCQNHHPWGVRRFLGYILPYTTPTPTLHHCKKTSF